MTDLVVGKGRLYFEPFVQGTRRRTGAGFAYFGNTPELTVTKDGDTLEHFDSQGGLKQKDFSMDVSETTGGAFTTDNINIQNIAFWYRSGNTPVQQLAGTDIVDIWTAAVRGNYFQLGESADTPMGARKVTVTDVSKGTVAATGTLTFSTAVPVEGDSVTINGRSYTFRANPIGTTDVLIGATLALTATNLADAINENDLSVTAAAAAAVVTVTAVSKGVGGNSLTLAKAFTTAGNMTLSGATLAGGASVAINEDNYSVRAETGLVRIKADAPGVSDGDAIEITYDQAAMAMSVVVASNQTLEGRLMFQSDNPVGANKDHIWPYVKLKANGDYALIGDEFQTLGFSYEVLKLDDDTDTEIIIER